jgi:hemin uptake protein HemP
MMCTDKQQPVSPNSPSEPPVPCTPKRIDSSELLHGCNEIIITHNSELYRLRLTRNGKLILQK